MKKKGIGECYICGEIKDLTDDHVPPESLFPKPIPQDYNLITLPACLNCNAKWGEAEQKFVQDLSVVGASKDSHSVFSQNTRANYMRGLLLRGKPSKDYYSIMSRMKKSYLKTEGGVVLPDSVHLFYIPQDRDEVIVKIARGLHRKYKGKRLPSDIYADVIMRVPRIQDNFFDLFIAKTVTGRFGEIFSYAGGFPSDSENMSFWFLGFYTNIDFLVLLADTLPPEEIKFGGSLRSCLPKNN